VRRGLAARWTRIAKARRSRRLRPSASEPRWGPDRQPPPDPCRSVATRNRHDEWTVTGRDGIEQHFGYADPADRATTVLADPRDQDRVFAWRVHEARDPFGNSTDGSGKASTRHISAPFQRLLTSPARERLAAAGASRGPRTVPRTPRGEV
jgi:hypothetical protein